MDFWEWKIGLELICVSNNTTMIEYAGRYYSIGTQLSNLLLDDRRTDLLDSNDFNGSCYSAPRLTNGRGIVSWASLSPMSRRFICKSHNVGLKGGLGKQ